MFPTGSCRRSAHDGKGSEGLGGHGDGAGQGVIETTFDIDGGELIPFVDGRADELAALPGNVRLDRVRLGADGQVLPCRHGHGPRHKATAAGGHHFEGRWPRRSDADDQASRGNDPVVGAENDCSQPTDARRVVMLFVPLGGNRFRLSRRRA